MVAFRLSTADFLVFSPRHSRCAATRSLPVLAIPLDFAGNTMPVLISGSLPVSGHEIRVGHKKRTPWEGFSIFGWYPGWLGVYIIYSIVMSIGLRVSDFEA